MRTRSLAAVGLAIVLGLGATGLAAHADEAPAGSVASAAPEVSPTTATPSTPTPTATEEPPKPTEQKIDNAQFRWSIQRHLHKKPYDGQNFLMAGALPDTEGQNMAPGLWKQAEGAVSIVRASGATYVPATWNGFGTGVDHQVVINGGTGTVDLKNRTATIAWTGTFGIARYTGQTGFTVKNPKLVVANGKGHVEATLEGFGVSRDGNGSGSVTGPLTPTLVHLADLGKVTLASKGFTSTPAFYGVKVSHPEQQKDAKGRWGAFPASFIGFVDKVGQAPFWMTSVSSDNDEKVPSPVTISFNAQDAVVVKPPKPSERTPKPIDNKTRTAPEQPTAPKQNTRQQPPPTGFVPLSTPAISTAPVQAASFTPTSTISLAGASVVPDSQDRASALGWWLAATFLIMASIAVAIPGFIARSRAT